MRSQGAIVRVSVERPVNAPASDVYRLIADYRNHHPAILASAFYDLVVEQGGVGEGTEISYSMRVAGRSKRVRAVVTEPDPGRIISETDSERGAITSFVVAREGDRSRVRIETEFESLSGIRGWFERRFAPAMLRKYFVEELENLDTYARIQAA